MNTKILAPAFFSLILGISGSAFAKTGAITISAPADGSTVTPNDNVTITYEATFTPNGDHFHLYLDKKRLDILRQPKGSAKVGMIPAGKHRICLEENTKGHVPTDLKACIDITSK